MRYIIFFLSLTAINYSCSHSKSNDGTLRVNDIDTVKYSYDGFNNGFELNLLSDGRFIDENYLFSCTGGGERRKVFGTYKMDGGALTLLPEKVEFTEYSSIRTLNPKITNSEYNADSFEIKTNFSMIEWGKNSYLLSDHLDASFYRKKENDYMKFAEYLNSGFEPNISGSYLAYKVSDSITSDFDLEQIPKEWQKYFLEEPISARVRDIKKIIDPNNAESISWQIVLDKAIEKQMKNRLSFETQDHEFYITIDSISKNESFGIIYRDDFSPQKLPVGTELRTTWK